MNTYFYEYRGTKAQEQFLRIFLMQHADTLRLTNNIFSEIGFFYVRRHGSSNDHLLHNTLAMLRPYFSKKVIDNTRYNNIPQGKKSKFQHYFFHLSISLKKMVNRETLFWNNAPPGLSKVFYTLEDPVFYRQGKIIGWVISHENCVCLNLSEAEYTKMKKKVPQMKQIQS